MVAGGGWSWEATEKCHDNIQQTHQQQVSWMIPELELHFEIPAIVQQRNPGTTQQPNVKRYKKITKLKFK